MSWVKQWVRAFVYVFLRERKRRNICHYWRIRAWECVGFKVLPLTTLTASIFGSFQAKKNTHRTITLYPCVWLDSIGNSKGLIGHYFSKGKQQFIADILNSKVLVEALMMTRRHYQSIIKSTRWFYIAWSFIQNNDLFKVGVTFAHC